MEVDGRMVTWGRRAVQHLKKRPFAGQQLVLSSPTLCPRQHCAAPGCTASAASGSSYSPRPLETTLMIIIKKSSTYKLTEHYLQIINWQLLPALVDTWYVPSTLNRYEYFDLWINLIASANWCDLMILSRLYYPVELPDLRLITLNAINFVTLFHYK